MGLLFEEIDMIRGLHKYLDKKDWDKNYIDAKVALLSQADKRHKTLLQIMSYAVKYKKNGQRFLDRLYKTNLITEHEAISLTGIDFDKEAVLCPVLDKQMTRGECLEYSGEEQNYEDCKGCEIGTSTKRLLCPAVQEHV
jgi:hypothetical protein